MNESQIAAPVVRPPFPFGFVSILFGIFVILIAVAGLSLTAVQAGGLVSGVATDPNAALQKSLGFSVLRMAALPFAVAGVALATVGLIRDERRRRGVIGLIINVAMLALFL